MAMSDGARAILLVSVIALVAALVVTGSYELARERIAENERERLLASLHQVLPADAHDNDLSRSRVSVRDPVLLGTDTSVDVFLATKEGMPVAALFTSVAPDGYNAPIRLLIGISTAGVVTGVRVLSHRETPGLGDWIDALKSDWITHFTGASLETHPPQAWTIEQEGGSFDAFTGATVTPRAVIKAVHNTLLFFQEHRQELLARARELGAVPEASPDE
jgi:electron transport complex protein RnfG